jgi:hypothetical protein
MMWFNGMAIRSKDSQSRNAHPLILSSLSPNFASVVFLPIIECLSLDDFDRRQVDAQQRFTGTECLVSNSFQLATFNISRASQHQNARISTILTPGIFARLKEGQPQNTTPSILSAPLCHSNSSKFFDVPMLM